jgi:flagellar hook-length control protein FliK
MSASVSSTPTTASASATTSSPATTSSLGEGISILGSGNGLFGHILNLGNMEQSMIDGQLNKPLSIAVIGNNVSSSLDSSILTLSQELSGLSTEDLQSLIDNAKLGDNPDTIIGIKSLKSLTPGIPSLEVEQVQNIDTSPLLSAINVTPEKISDLTSAIKMIEGSPNDDEGLLSVDNSEKPDLIEMSNELSNEMIMVAYLPLQASLTTPDLSDLELDPSIFSSLTKVTQPKSSSPSLFDDAIDLYSGGDSGLSFTDEDGKKLDFQGSLASLNGHKGNDKESKLDISSSNISGQLWSSTGSGLMGTFGAPFSHFDETSLLMMDTNSIGSHHLSANTNPLFTSSSATGSHPATQFIAKMIEKAATGSEKSKQELTVQLDPPELGRMQIQLSMEKGENMKVHLIAEKQETLTLLQRDSHAIKSALDSAGIQTDGSSLTFDLSSGDQSFNQFLGGSNDGTSGRNTHLSINTNGSIVNEDQAQALSKETYFHTDQMTGNIHYSLIA